MRRSGKIIFILGCLLLAAGLGLLVVWQMTAVQSSRTNAAIVEVMDTILTDRREGVKDAQLNGPMPALELQGEDFAALLDFPAYGLKFPVCASWKPQKLVSYPCIFDGTAYRGDLVIGGYDQPGQFDFFDRVADGTVITLTDMTGSTFCYVVDRVDRSSSAQPEVFSNEDADLTLFVRDAQYLEYIILRCRMK